MKLSEQIKTESASHEHPWPRVERITRYEFKSRNAAVQLVDCKAGEHCWGVVVLELDRSIEPSCFEINADDLDAVCALLNAACAMKHQQ